MHTTIRVGRMMQEVAYSMRLMISDLVLMSWYRDNYTTLDELPSAPTYRKIVTKSVATMFPLVFRDRGIVGDSLKRLVASGMLLKSEAQLERSFCYAPGPNYNRLFAPFDGGKPAEQKSKSKEEMILGPHKMVRLTRSQYNNLVAAFSENWVNKAIVSMETYYLGQGKKSIKNPEKALYAWMARRDLEVQQKMDYMNVIGNALKNIVDQLPPEVLQGRDLNNAVREIFIETAQKTLGEQVARTLLLGRGIWLPEKREARRNAAEECDPEEFDPLDY